MLKRILVLLLSLSLAAPALAGGYRGYGYGGHFGYRHHGGGNGDVLLAGLVIGGLLGYFISEDRYYRRHSYTTYSYRHDPYYYDDYGYYAYEPRVYRKYVRVTPPPRVIVREVPAQTDFEFAGRNCQMTREYTTTIEIDGEKQDAYGTRCLTADGSWVLGKPRLVPEFDN